MKRIPKGLILALLIVVVSFFVFTFCEEIAAGKRALYARIRQVTTSEEMVEEATESREFEERYAAFPAFESVEDAWYQVSRYIYHAGGGIDGLAYTNSLEAIETSLRERGNILEIDFSYTSDGELVCIHYWDYVLGSEAPLTLQEFKDNKIYAKYTPLTAEELIAVMEREEDMYVVIDTKEGESVKVVQDLLRLAGNRPEIVDRMIVQLYFEDTKYLFEELYPFKNENFLFTCYKFGEDYQAALDVCMKENISIVTVPYGVWTAEEIEMFNQKGIIVYEHTVNRLDLVQEAMDRGVYGIYTDYLTDPIP